MALFAVRINSAQRILILNQISRVVSHRVYGSFFVASNSVPEVLTTTMQPISRPPQPKKPPVRFGSSGGGSGLGGVTGAVDTLFRSFQNSRGKEMIVEDVVGFGVLRTGMDLHRNKMYGDNSWNVPAAAERFFREISSILTDSVLGGVVAWGMGKAVFDRKNKAFSNEFIQYPSLELFQDIVNSGALKSAKTADEAKGAFSKALAERVVGDQASAKSDKLADIIKEAWSVDKPKQTDWEKGTSWLRANPNAGTFNGKGKAFIKALDNKATDFDWKFNTRGTGKPETFAVNELLDDVNRFGRSMGNAWENKVANNWHDLAEKGLKRTLTAKNWAIPIALATGMGATFAMPFLSNFLTKKVYGIDYFPGETGLKKNQPEQAKASDTNKSFMERNFPYVSKATKDGNPLPLGIALLPLVAAAGIFTANRSVMNPFAKGALNKFRKAFDFTKAAPFTSPQQMASMFALLITSRLLCSRSDNEYQERMLDSFAGWMFWILGTPLMKTAASKLSGQEGLFKAGGGLKSREAVEYFSKKALPANVRIGIGSTLATMGILGIGAPLAGIKLTQWNERRKQQNLTQQSQTQSQPVLPPAPSSQPNRFALPATVNAPFSQANPSVNPYAWQPPKGA